jgi:hypothetical protein
MAEYEIQPILYYKHKISEKKIIYNALENRTSEFEPILGSEKQFYRNKMGRFRTAVG